MSRRLVMLMTLVAALHFICPRADAISINSLNNFEGGVTQGWSGAGPTVQLGGPAGAGDHFLRVIADNDSFGGRLVTFNRGTDWTGNYITAGVTRIAMDLKNLDDVAPVEPLFVRVALKESVLRDAPGYVTTNGFALPADNAWHRAVFNLTTADMTGISASNLTLANLLANPAELRILHSVAPAINGDNLFSKLGIDNIQALGPAAVVTDRRVFYNNSGYDRFDAAANALDDAAIPSGKVALLPGHVATSSNYTNYTRGINGISIDIKNLQGTPTPGDFVFKVGNDNNPAGWATLGVAPTVSVRAGATAADPSRVSLVFPDAAVMGQWLQVTVKSSLGLDTPDVFYFGNAVGESGNSSTDAIVSKADEDATFANPASFRTPADINSPYDHDHDGFVNAADIVFSRSNSTNANTALKLISVPASLSAVSVPEPATVVLLITAAPLLIVARRRRAGSQTKALK